MVNADFQNGFIMGLASKGITSTYKSHFEFTDCFDENDIVFGKSDFCKEDALPEGLGFTDCYEDDDIIFGKGYPLRVGYYKDNEFYSDSAYTTKLTKTSGYAYVDNATNVYYLCDGTNYNIMEV